MDRKSLARELLAFFTRSVEKVLSQSDSQVAILSEQSSLEDGRSMEFQILSVEKQGLVTEMHVVAFSDGPSGTLGTVDVLVGGKSVSARVVRAYHEGVPHDVINTID